VGRAVPRMCGFAAGDVARVLARVLARVAGIEVGELVAGGLKLAVGGAKLDAATLGWLETLGWLKTRATAPGSFVVWADSDTAPRLTATAAPNTAAAEPRIAIHRNDIGRRLTHALGRARDLLGRPELCRPPGKRFKMHR
jgi:hypothetical protein